MAENSPKGPTLPDAGSPETPDAGCQPVPPIIPEYDLLRGIGKGSYGEVWLARSVTGQFRAVKIVYRQTFEHPRPFEREFTGIRKYEPISRSHDGLVDILHVGRNDPAGYFFYVMELGDDAVTAQDINPQTYATKTLQTEVTKRGRLPVEECIRFGLSLTAALAQMHQHDLVHRDIKPSNIIFVDGVPKLADIGLVTNVDEAKSFVGTEGFIPREGPGTPQADLYSLGKVLYEIAMGKDREAFPELPTDLGTIAERDKLLAVNGVILKACAMDVRRRYQTAREMHDALQRVQDDIHGTGGRSKKATKIVIIGMVALLILVASVALGLRMGRPPRTPTAAPVPLTQTPRTEPPDSRGVNPEEPTLPKSESAIFTHEDLYSFLSKIIEDKHSKFALRMTYTEIATTIDRGRYGTWRISRGMTRDRRAYMVTVQTGAWFAREMSPREVAEEGPAQGIRRTVNGVFELPEEPLATLAEPDFRVVTNASGEGALTGRIQCVLQSPRWVDHLVLVFKSPSYDRNGVTERYQYFHTNDLPQGWLQVSIPLDSMVNLEFGGQLSLQAFLSRPRAGFFRVSNEVMWMSRTSER